jgi:hypothetical protein
LAALVFLPLLKIESQPDEYLSLEPIRMIDTRNLQKREMMKRICDVSCVCRLLNHRVQCVKCGRKREGEACMAGRGRIWKGEAPAEPGLAYHARSHAVLVPTLRVANASLRRSASRRWSPLPGREAAGRAFPRGAWERVEV